MVNRYLNRGKISTMNKQLIVFKNGNEAKAVAASMNGKMQEALKILEVKPYKSVVLILGGADELEESRKAKLLQLFDRGIARAAAETNSVVVDGGTDSGVMALMGQGVACRGFQSGLIGVVPAGMVTYPGSAKTNGTPLEPNHTHFVLVDGSSWGSETTAMFNLVKALTNKVTDSGKSVKVPATAILASGGSTSKAEVLNAVRMNLPLIVIEGSGNFADEVAAACRANEIPDDPVLAEIVADGNIHIHSINSSVKSMERTIIRQLDDDKVLMQAWETFADYDFNANLQQQKFNRIQLAILLIGVVGTALVVIQQAFAPRDASHELLNSSQLWNSGAMGWFIIRHLLIITPILLTVLITAATRFKQGAKWLLLRASAESIKREIFRYRTGAMYYKVNPEHQLAKKVEEITLRTMRTEVNISALKPYNKEKGFPPHMFAAEGGDDGFSHLSPDRYVEVRLGDQLRYFKKRTVSLDLQLKVLYWATFIIGGIGTYLAAIDMQVWIALTTSTVVAFGTYLGYRQTENTLTKYNQAATDLANVRGWWNALSSEEQARQVNIDSLVEHTELVLQSELDGWVQQMQNALANLRKGQESSDEKEELKESTETEEPVRTVKQQENVAATAVVHANGLRVAESRLPREQEDRSAKNGSKTAGELVITGFEETAITKPQV
jgi:hypothetical protein